MYSENDNSSVGTDESVTYEVDSSESPSEAVIRAVSEVSGYETVKSAGGSAPVLDPLYTAIDPDALDALFSRLRADGSRPRGQVTFTYDGHEVTVHSSGTIRVKPLR